MKGKVTFERSKYRAFKFRLDESRYNSEHFGTKFMLLCFFASIYVKKKIYIYICFPLVQKFYTLLFRNTNFHVTGRIKVEHKQQKGPDRQNN